MPYCPKCGIKVKEEVSGCPLCRHALQEEKPKIERFFPEEINHPAELPFDWAYLRKRLFTVLSGGIMLAIVLVAIIDLSTGMKGWSPYTIIPLMASWGSLSVLLYGYTRPVTMLAKLVVICFLMIIGLDSLDGEAERSFKIGLPVSLAILVLYGPFVTKLFRKNLHWASVINWFLVATALFCFVIDFFVSWTLDGRAGLGWSVAVGLILMPPICFLLYIRYRLVKVVDLAKIFHW